MPTKTTAKTDVEKPSTSEQLADDAASQTVEYPDGCPELVAVLRLPRLRRADYYDAMAVVSALQKTVGAVERVTDDSLPMAVRLSEGADLTRLLAALEDVLVAVAADAAVFREWAMSADDIVLTQAFNAYIARTQPGEARSSAS